MSILSLWHRRTALAGLLAAIGVVRCASPSRRPPPLPAYPSPLASPGTAARGASTAAAAETVWDIPNLPGIRVDGQDDDWQGRGLLLDVLTALPADSRDSEQFDATARLGWDDRGLLVLCHVVDTTPWEADATKPAWSGDSVELFMADTVGGKNALQFV